MELLKKIAVILALSPVFGSFTANAHHGRRCHRHYCHRPSRSCCRRPKVGINFSFGPRYRTSRYRTYRYYPETRTRVVRRYRRPARRVVKRRYSPYYEKETVYEAPAYEYETVRYERPVHSVIVEERPHPISLLTDFAGVMVDAFC